MEIIIKKVPADSVPYGEQVCTRGNSVWAAFDHDKFICCAATAEELRRTLQLRTGRESHERWKRMAREGT
jgi:hypothetical protein